MQGLRVLGQSIAEYAYVGQLCDEALKPETYSLDYPKLLGLGVNPLLGWFLAALPGWLKAARLLSEDQGM